MEKAKNTPKSIYLYNGKIYKDPFICPVCGKKDIIPKKTRARFGSIQAVCSYHCGKHNWHVDYDDLQKDTKFLQRYNKRYPMRIIVENSKEKQIREQKVSVKTGITLLKSFEPFKSAPVRVVNGKGGGFKCPICKKDSILYSAAHCSGRMPVSRFTCGKHHWEYDSYPY